MSIWKLSFVRSATRLNSRVHDSESLEWSASSEPEISLLDDDTAHAVVTDPAAETRTRRTEHSGSGCQPSPGGLRLMFREWVGEKIAAARLFAADTDSFDTAQFAAPWRSGHDAKNPGSVGTHSSLKSIFAPSGETVACRREVSRVLYFLGTSALGGVQPGLDLGILVVSAVLAMTSTL